MRGGAVLWMFTSALCFLWHHGRGLLSAEDRVCMHWSRHSRFLPASEPTRFLARRQRLGVLSLPFPCGDHVCLFTRKSVGTFYKRDTCKKSQSPAWHTHIFYALGVFLIGRNLCIPACGGRHLAVARDQPFLIQCPVASSNTSHITSAQVLYRGCAPRQHTGQNKIFCLLPVDGMVASSG